MFNLPDPGSGRTDTPRRRHSVHSLTARTDSRTQAGIASTPNPEPVRIGRSELHLHSATDPDRCFRGPPVTGQRDWPVSSIHTSSFIDRGYAFKKPPAKQKLEAQCHLTYLCDEGRRGRRGGAHRAVPVPAGKSFGGVRIVFERVDGSGVQHDPPSSGDF